MKVVEGKMPDAPYMMAIYGVAGVGKSTLATSAKDPIHLDIEGGADRVNCARYQADDWPDDRTKFQTIDEVRRAIEEIKSIGEFQTVVFDGFTALEEMLIKEILDSVGGKVESINDKKVFGYGSGIDLLKQKFLKLFREIQGIKEAGKSVILIGHDVVEKVESPTGDNYDRYTLQLHRRIAPIVIAKCDAVLFAQYDRVFKSRDGNSDKKVAIEVDKGARSVITEEKPFCIAKNRFGLPDKVSFKELEERRALFEMIH